ncbi:amidohydrolase family protein [Roseomonas gilardii]|uniref:amidohydrolase family protein n=1 Tax=Roseomonas gilardii TaxID=257708 RepID=UPI00047F4A97|nr:amidohydrolase family protein [Roseomonas gilardii]SUE42660.1 Predicted metal-dependent hydrolase of the TIM-barrel fold [Roseomonas gilardii subsp. rosea]
MIIDCHGHFTTVPKSFRDWRARQVETADDPLNAPDKRDAILSDDQIREAIEGGQLRLQQERGSDLTLFSPIAGLMSHHLGNERTSLEWAEISNNNVKRVTELFPQNFAPVCQLPQSPGAPPANSIPELRRCVEEMGFVGCNINPDPTGGYWTGKPFTDREWYPLFEAMCELDVPGMVHVAASCNPNFHGTGAHYLNADTSVFMQILQSDLFRDFPTLRLVIPHGGGAVPYHWGRYRGMSLEMMERPLEGLLDNIFFDTCVYHKPGVALLTEVIPADNVLFGSEMIGAVRGKDPCTGHHFDDTKRYVDGLALSAEDKRKIFEGNARRVYPRLDALLRTQGR